MSKEELIILKNELTKQDLIKSANSKNSLPFRNERWKMKDKSNQDKFVYTPLKYLETTHLIQIMRTIRAIADEYNNNISGKSRDEWIKVIKKELSYRTSVANRILYAFKGIDKIFHAAERGYYRNEKNEVVVMQP